MGVYYEYNKKQISFLVAILLPCSQCVFHIWHTMLIILCFFGTLIVHDSALSQTMDFILHMDAGH